MTSDVRTARGGSRAVQLTLRSAITLQAALVLVQAVTAGQILTGAAAGVHQTGATALHVVALVQLIAAVLLWRPGGGPGWPALASLVVMVAGFMQSATGGMGNLAVHVPLGMTVFGLAVALLVWTWRPAAR
ncbi:hypothetical protein [Bailinhaonella thermotolerans]|uniref:Uncharacterized protein n=1 Tax=Bailinhaonella thermotolerans TaxID=1070861 RepID=A0A3A4B0E3_9ACTN|nr:hypothetical protein [Bailinhaonella thermotolerans]RJL34319.1 hypothetical protein D5H75_07670 [Bailinhaonella thermotolerans]